MPRVNTVTMMTVTYNPEKEGVSFQPQNGGFF